MSGQGVEPAADPDYQSIVDCHWSVIMIRFVSIVPEWFGGTSLSLVVLKSYLLAVKPYISISSDTFFSHENPADIATQILSGNENVFGFSIYMWNLETASKVSVLLKEKNPDCFIIWGGPGACFEGKSIIKKNPAVDVIVKGEGEIPLADIISEIEKQNPDLSHVPNLLYRKNEQVIETTFEADALILENQHYLLNTKGLEKIKSFYYETSRGCLFKCNYCAWTMMHEKKGVRRYPPDKVMADLESLFSLPLLEMLLLTDSNILLGKNRTIKIFSAINKLNQKRRKNGLSMIKINFEFNPEHLNEKMLREIKKVRVENYPIGLQSVNPGVLKVANRPFNKKRYVENIGKLRGKVGASILVEVIYGLPADSYEGFKKTLEFVISELNVDLLVCYRYSVLPGSVFWKQKEKYKMKHEAVPPYLLLSSDTFSEHDMNKAECLAYYIQLIYRVFRSLKKYIDKKIPGNRVLIYEKIADMFFSEYGDFLKPKLVYDNGFAEDIKKVRDRKNASVRRAMLSKARELADRFVD